MRGYGDFIDGREFQDQRTHGMSVTVPPEDYRWHHHEFNTGQGNDSTVSTLTTQTKETLRDIRLTWLDQFELEVREEKNYRWWRWLGGDSDLRGAYNDESGRPRQVVWAERRPIDAPLPKIPGLWPNDE